MLKQGESREKPTEPYLEIAAALQAVKPLDYWPTDGWRTAKPEEHGVDSAGIAAMVDGLAKDNVRSFVLVRDGYLLAEGYNRDWEPDQRHPMLSVTKSFVSTLTGMAIADGAVEGVGQKLDQFFPEISSDPKKSSITVEQLLAMTSGLEWDNREERSSREMADSPDWGRYVLSRAMAAEPGTRFHYNNGNAHLLSILLQKAVGFSLSIYAKINMFDPMGMTNVTWGEDLQEHLLGAWGLNMTARDMAKLGLLYLQGGKWDDHTIVPDTWIQASVQKHSAPIYDDGTEGGYGYFWWLKRVAPETGDKSYGVFFAAGSGGQRIFVVPELNLILAMTANNQHDDFMPERLLARAMLAVKSDRPLAVNDIAAARLKASIRAFKATTERPA